MRVVVRAHMVAGMSVAVRARAADLLSLMSDETRLLVLAELVRRGDGGATLTEIAESLGLPLAKVGDACARMTSLEVVTRANGRYRARLLGLREASNDLDGLQPISRLLTEYPKLRGVFSHGRLIAMPVLFGDVYWQLAEMLARFIDLDGLVDEAEINERLSGVTDDVALIRRMLVDTGWLERDRAGTTYGPSHPQTR